MAVSSLESVWLKIDRAKQHIENLEALIIAYHKSGPYHIITVDDPQTGRRIAKIGGEPAPIPYAIPLTLGDAAHAIRSSLDHFAWAAVPRPDKNTAFPLWNRGRSGKELRALLGGKVRGASRPLTQALYDLQPYEGGSEEYVWLVDYLDRIDKHRLLLTVGIAYQALIFDPVVELREAADWTKSLPAFPISISPDERYPVKNGLELFIADPEYFEKHKDDLKFRFEIAFGEPQTLVSEPIIQTLHRLLGEVETLLKRLIALA
jgi:hypothetical protein